MKQSITKGRLIISYLDLAGFFDHLHFSSSRSLTNPSISNIKPEGFAKVFTKGLAPFEYSLSASL